MDYSKPEIVVLGPAHRAVQSGQKGLHAGQDYDYVTMAAYEADE